MFPARFPTLGNGSIPNPAKLYEDGRNNAIVFEGNVADYNFKKQLNNFNALNAVLIANGTELTTITAAEFDGHHYSANNCRQVRFVCLAQNGSLTWYKYAGHNNAGNQNDVYVGGKKMHLSVFLSLEDSKQRALLGGNPSIMAIADV